MARQVDADVIGRLFDRMGALYGSAWDRSIGMTPIADVKTVWGEYLAGFDVDDISYALDKLSEKCPNVFGFRDLCRAAPKKQMLQLERPQVDQLKISEEIAKQVKVKEAMQQHLYNPKAWAPRIINRHQNGEKISPAVLKMAKDTVNGWQP